MSCQHHVGFEAGIFDERQKHELSVPHGDDARVMMRVLFEPLRHALVLPRGAADESDVTREQRADRGVDEFGLGLSVRHSGGHLPAWFDCKKLSGMGNSITYPQHTLEASIRRLPAVSSNRAAQAAD